MIGQDNTLKALLAGFVGLIVACLVGFLACFVAGTLIVFALGLLAILYGPLRCWLLVPLVIVLAYVLRKGWVHKSDMLRAATYAKCCGWSIYLSGFLFKGCGVAFVWRKRNG